jgi:hypothetical protein
MALQEDLVSALFPGKGKGLREVNKSKLTL